MHQFCINGQGLGGAGERSPRSRERDELRWRLRSGGRRGPRSAPSPRRSCSACRAPRRSQQVVAFVNGAPITDLDIEHRAKFMQLSNEKGAGAQGSDGQPDQRNPGDNEAKRYGLEIPEARSQQGFRNTAAAPHGHRRAEAHAVHRPPLAPAPTPSSAASAGAAGLEPTSCAGASRRASKSATRMSKRSLQLHKSDEKEESATSTSCHPWSSSCRAVPRMPRSRRASAKPTPCARAFRVAAKAFRSPAPSGSRRARTGFEFSADLPQQLREILDGTAVGHLTPPE